MPKLDSLILYGLDIDHRSIIIAKLLFVFDNQHRIVLQKMGVAGCF
jgi:hypothetical protein